MSRALMAHGEQFLGDVPAVMELVLPIRDTPCLGQVSTSATAAPAAAVGSEELKLGWRQRRGGQGAPRPGTLEWPHPSHVPLLGDKDSHLPGDRALAAGAESVGWEEGWWALEGSLC